MSVKGNGSGNGKTGEDSIIEFPCYFPIKIIGNNSESFLSDIKTIIDPFVIQPHQPEFSTKTSKNQLYLSITVTIYVENQLALDSIYRAVTQHPDIKMVL